MSKVSARWALKLLSEEEKQTRSRCSAVFLERYAAEGDEFLDRIVTTDETCLHHYDLEMKALSSVLKRDYVNVLKRKRPALDLDRVILHQDNAPVHRANSTQLEITLLGFELLEHPPYSPDLAPMDFRTFPEIKTSLRGQRFHDVADLTLATSRKVSQLDTDWYRETFTKWIARHQKYVALCGDYVEKVRRSLDLDNV
ncbi:histone-lysine N-methyltransferase SETMAR-like [Mercenaria mercenaria]|uniref:histone-lysine N-methyltransferase SETMAR-like n=1 Tax=Mercenaria mercenaria TaxID=6596 RepID=UPI00234E9237|nr:histone-lysine N-methyltransferase SETMAR-like [Mercenaria mercenaria]